MATPPPFFGLLSTLPQPDRLLLSQGPASTAPYVPAGYFPVGPGAALLQLPAPPAATTAIVQQCSLMASQHQPCDAAMLKLEHIPKDEAKPGFERKEGYHQTVTCTSKAAGDASVSPAHRSLLGSDDLLLQVIADYVTGALTKGSEDDLRHARIVLSGTLDPACATGVHRTGKYQIDANKEQTDFTLPACNAPLPLLAPPLAGGFFAELLGLWPFQAGRRKTMAVNLPSCGVHPGRPPVGSLKGRVEVWPNDNIEIILKIPAMANRKRSGSWAVEYTRTHDDGASLAYVEKHTKSRASGVLSRDSSSVSTSQSVGIGKDGLTVSKSTSVDSSNRTLGISRDGVSLSHSGSSETSTQSATMNRNGVSLSNKVSAESSGAALAVNPNHVTLATASSQGSTGQQLAIGQSGTRLTETAQASAGLMLYRAPTSAASFLASAADFIASGQAGGDSDPFLSIKRNGHELDFIALLNQILKAAEDFEAFLHALLTPKISIGLSYSLDIAFMQGTLTACWGVLPKATPENDRIWLVDNYFGIDVKLTVVSAAAAVKFGVSLEFGTIGAWSAVSVVAEVSLTLALDASLSANWKSIAEQEKRFPVELTGSLTGAVTGKAMLLGTGFVSEASISVGAEGKIELVLSKAAPFRIEVKVGVKPVEVNMWAKGPFDITYHKTITWPEEGHTPSKDFHWPEATSGGAG